MSDEPAPTTVVQRQLVVFLLDNERYAVPIDELKEIVKAMPVTPVPSSPEFILGVINLRGKILPVLDLEKLFNLQRDTAPAAAPHIMVVEAETDNSYGVQVDTVAEIIKAGEDMIQPAPSMVTARISADYVDGVIVTAGPHDQNQDVLLLLSLRKIITREVIEAAETALHDSSSSEAEPAEQTNDNKEEQT